MNEALNLDTDKVFISDNGDYVRLVHRFAENETQYHLGFRFHGDNGINYTATGGVEGVMAGLPVQQDHAVPLVQEFIETGPTLFMALNAYYHNGLGQIVQIIGLVPETSRFYKRGYRYMDHRGSYYREDGVTDTGMWQKLNLTDQIFEPVDHATFAAITKTAAKTTARRRRRAVVTGFMKRVGLPAGLGAALGTAVASAAA